ncbi:MAG: hypothetical protein EHM33_30295, partial [Chloroflexi bacterium]
MSAIQDLTYNLSVEMPIGIAIVKQGIALIIHITRVIPWETKNIATLILDAIELELQVDGAAVVLNPHQVNDRLSVSTRQ